MKNKLKNITNSTLDELLVNEVVLPSAYLQCFDKYARFLNISIDNSDFEKELNKVLLEDYNMVNNYVNKAIRSIDSVVTITQEAQKAMQDTNESTLKKLYEQISVLKDELEDITKEIYIDPLTKIYNKKWFYHKFLSKGSKYKDNSTVILLDICDYEYIAKKYNKLIANNLIVFIIKYLQKILTEEFVDFDFIRYLDNKFIIAIKDKNDLSSINSFIESIKIYLISTTLRSTSGVIIKPNFKYSMVVAHKGGYFHDSLEILLENLK